MVAITLYIASVVAANAAIRAFGVVPVGFGLMAPAGVLFVGLSFTLRDVAHEQAGRRAVIWAILAGAAISALFSPALAVASGVAFLVSEMADLAVYEPLRNRNLLGAVVASNVVGLVLDSALFLWLAFGSLEFMAGQVVAKGYMTLLAIPAILLARRYVREPAFAGVR